VGFLVAGAMVALAKWQENVAPVSDLTKEVHAIFFLFFLHGAPVSDLNQRGAHNIFLGGGGFFFPGARDHGRVFISYFSLILLKCFLGAHDYGRVEGDAQGQENPPGRRGAISV
jgi:hypothetical protein